MVSEMDTTNMFKKIYKMRSVGDNGLNTVVSIPRIVLQREANKRGVSLEDFIKHYRAVALFDNIDGVHYIFEKMDEH